MLEDEEEIFDDEDEDFLGENKFCDCNDCGVSVPICDISNGLCSECRAERKYDNRW